MIVNLIMRKKVMLNLLIMRKKVMLNLLIIRKQKMSLHPGVQP